MFDARGDGAEARGGGHVSLPPQTAAEPLETEPATPSSGQGRAVFYTQPPGELGATHRFLQGPSRTLPQPRESIRRSDGGDQAQPGFRSHFLYRSRWPVGSGPPSVGAASAVPGLPLSPPGALCRNI